MRMMTWLLLGRGRGEGGKDENLGSLRGIISFSFRSCVGKDQYRVYHIRMQLAEG